MIYLDNAATTLKKPREVAEAVVQAMQSLGNCARGTHTGSQSAARAVYQARVKIARFFGCTRADHVIFTANATHSLNIALNGLFAAGDHVITTAAEHNSVLRPLYRLEKEQGLCIDLIPADKKGNLCLSALPRLLKSNTKAIVCTHASNLTGNVTDLKEISAFAKEHGLLLVVDASQSAGFLPIHMEKTGIDVLCVTGHKGLMGPQGIGCLCIGQGVQLRPLMVGGTGVQSYSQSQPAQLPERLEAGTLNAHGIAGLSAAIDYIERVGLDTVYAHETALTRKFYKGVRSLPGVTVYGDFSREHAPIVALNIASWESGTVSDILSEEFGIATRSGAHCAPEMHKALGTQQQGAVRFSFSFFNTDADVDAAIRAVETLCKDAADHSADDRTAAMERA